MHVKIDLDGHSRRATFERSIYPMNVGEDLETVRTALDNAYTEARDWLTREIDRRQ